MDNNFNTQNDIIDISIKSSRKKIRINGDDNNILEIDLSDMNTLDRLNNKYPTLLNCVDKVKELADFDTSTDDKILELGTRFSAIDNEMRLALDEIFDANVSETCAPSGSMYDPVDGQFRFEIIIDTLTKLYESNMNTEFNKMKKRVNAKANAIKQSHAR